MTNVAKMVSEAWKNLTTDEREVWEEKARLDKRRYDLEKATYDGPCRVKVRRAKKDPSAPKKPMSAYLSFANSKRATIRSVHPKATNGEISKILATMWREAPQEVRQPYIDVEARLRDIYKVDIAAWRSRQQQKRAAEKKLQREATPDLKSLLVTSGKQGFHPIPFGSPALLGGDIMMHDAAKTATTRTGDESRSLGYQGEHVAAPSEDDLMQTRDSLFGDTNSNQPQSSLYTGSHPQYPIPQTQEPPTTMSCWNLTKPGISFERRYSVQGDMTIDTALSTCLESRGTVTPDFDEGLFDGSCRNRGSSQLEYESSLLQDVKDDFFDKTMEKTKDGCVEALERYLEDALGEDVLRDDPLMEDATRRNSMAGMNIDNVLDDLVAGLWADTSAV